MESEVVCTQSEHMVNSDDKTQFINDADLAGEDWSHSSSLVMVEMPGNDQGSMAEFDVPVNLNKNDEKVNATTVTLNSFNDSNNSLFSFLEVNRNMENRSQVINTLRFDDGAELTDDTSEYSYDPLFTFSEIEHNLSSFDDAEIVDDTSEYSNDPSFTCRENEQELGDTFIIPASVQLIPEKLAHSTETFIQSEIVRKQAHHVAKTQVLNDKDQDDEYISYSSALIVVDMSENDLQSTTESNAASLFYKADEKFNVTAETLSVLSVVEMIVEVTGVDRDKASIALFKARDDADAAIIQILSEESLVNMVMAITDVNRKTALTALSKAEYNADAATLEILSKKSVDTVVEVTGVSRQEAANKLFHERCSYFLL